MKISGIKNRLFHLALLLSLCMTTTLYSQVPHLLFGELCNSDGSSPEIEDVSFIAYNLTHANEIIHDTHSGQTGLTPIESPRSLIWIVQCSDFPSFWAVGDQVQIDFENSANGERKSIQITLTDEPYQDFGNLSLPVELSLFEAKWVDSKVEVLWRTEDEVECLGFNILRSVKEDAGYLKVNQHLIRSCGGVGISRDYYYMDNTPAKAVTYFYKLEEVSHSGNRTYYGPVAAEASSAHIPATFILHPNYPNPFNGETIFHFDVPVPSFITAEITDLAGRLIKQLQKGYLEAGTHEYRWNGENDLGGVCPSGIYFISITFCQRVYTHKIILLR